MLFNFSGNELPGLILPSKMKASISTSVNYRRPFRMMGPSFGSALDPTTRLQVFLPEYEPIYNTFVDYCNDFFDTEDPAIIPRLIEHLEDNLGVIAIRVAASSSPSSPCFPTFSFLEANFRNSPTPEPENSPTFLQWIWSTAAVIKPFMRPTIWTFLREHIPNDPNEPIIILAHVVYSVHGTTPYFTPTQATTALQGHIWQLSRDGSTLTKCEPLTPITAAEVKSCFHRLFCIHNKNQNTPYQLCRTPKAVSDSAPTFSFALQFEALLTKWTQLFHFNLLDRCINSSKPPCLPAPQLPSVNGILHTPGQSPDMPKHSTPDATHLSDEKSPSAWTLFRQHFGANETMSIPNTPAANSCIQQPQPSQAVPLPMSSTVSQPSNHSKQSARICLPMPIQEYDHTHPPNPNQSIVHSVSTCPIRHFAPLGILEYGVTHPP